ncbi:MAG: DUF3883 domain-containing protein [Actinobacteria bacterium]|nr:MAG: DUF3883 domain-containing protein [Actinomycetota bacterium]
MVQGSSGDSELERAVGVRLEHLAPGLTVSGAVGAGPVDVVSVTWHGGNLVTLTYLDAGGRADQVILGRDAEADLRIEAGAGAVSAFDGDPESWRLAAEALRIRNAAYFDPMLAVATSDVRPLPHQIRAVYDDGAMLDRSPLRFLLADDPGAGKTIMCGLYIKELLLRGDLARCLIVAPGSLVEQWQDELHDKFGLRFEILTRAMVEAGLDGEVFLAHPLLIARMDQLSRSDELLADLEQSDWDLVVVDEAHRMSAHYYSNELKATRRYELGRLLGRIARHLLLMTATPHAGKQEDFQLFLALLDGDRFEGRYRDGVHSVEPGDLMRRMVKEELLTMEGRPLFPERIAYTVPYELSDAEAELYQAVTEYVREEMNRADRLKAQGEGRRGNTVGFAMAVLQRRLASSPEAILRSLERRRDRLEARRREMQAVADGRPEPKLSQRLAELVGRSTADADDLDDVWDDLDGDEAETLEEEVVDAATAAKTVVELAAEIAILSDLAELARRVRHSGTDRKWSELRSILTDQGLVGGDAGERRKIIIFTEHRDTLNYLVDQIGTLLGRPEAVVAIHGGVRREQRRIVQEQFTANPHVRVLVATDAAGEGLNLQRAHLMVNYDLPWNPNRIEQRFGRIHRIGQTEVCHLWNLVAANTREGEVFTRLLEKIEQQRLAYAGKVFDVLGDAFAEQPLRALLWEAIRYGDQPQVRERLNVVIDATVGEGLDQLLAERALGHDTMADTDVERIRRRMEEVQARRLQPFYVRAFFLTAFARLGGRIAAREAGRYQVTHVPAIVRDRDRQRGGGATGAPVLTEYERVTFDRDHMALAGQVPAALVAPGHPLLDAVVDVTVERHASTLKHAAVLVDPRDHGQTPRLLVGVEQRINDGHSPARTLSKRFDFVELAPDGSAHAAGPAPYLDYEAPPDGLAKELVAAATELPGSWLAAGAEQVARNWAIEHLLGDHLAEVKARVLPDVARTRAQVHKRLTGEINYWDTRYNELADADSAGRQLKIRPETALRRARDLEARLTGRLAELDDDARVVALPPTIMGTALVVPQGLVDRLTGGSDQAAQHARETQRVERRAVDAVLAAERALGRTPEELPHNHPGYDLRSQTPDGTVVRIEVKGRVAGAEDFVITRNEVLTAKNLGDDYRLALVEVADDGPHADRVRYLTRPFEQTGTDDFTVTKFTMNWAERWAEGGEPL